MRQGLCSTNANESYSAIDAEFPNPTMDPAGTCKKSVPEWLNSSLWSSPRASSTSPPSTGRRLPVEAKASRKSQQKQENTVSSTPVSRDSATSDSRASSTSEAGVSVTSETEVRVPAAASEATVSEIYESRVSVAPEAGFCKESEESKPKPSDNGASEAMSSGRNRNGLIEEGEGTQRSKERLEDTQHAQSSSLPFLTDEESSDLFNSEGPLPSPLSSASLHTTTSTGSSVTRSSSFDSRVGRFNAELSKKVISITELQRLSSQGIPDVGSIRAITWKLLLGYLPKNRDYWSTELEKKRAEYAAFKEELLVTPSEVTRREDEALDISSKGSQGPLPRLDITQDDHPLSLGKTSIWHQFFMDSEVCEQIDRDVKRTHPDMHFFCGDSAASLDNQEAMKRVLFIFSKLNPGIRYVQGMNEVLAPLYYVLRTDTDELNAANAEADSFFCFVSLLGDFRDHFVQQLDNSAVGIRSTITRLNVLLKRHDEELWRHLEHTSKVNPQFYAFRWITLLLTQEFNFPDSLRLWDSLLGNPEGPLEILLRVCCAMLMSVRSRLLAGDFTSNLKLLQRYPSIDIHHLLRVADELKTNIFSSVNEVS